MMTLSGINYYYSDFKFNSITNGPPFNGLERFRRYYLNHYLIYDVEDIVVF